MFLWGTKNLTQKIVTEVTNLAVMRKVLGFNLNQCRGSSWLSKVLPDKRRYILQFVTAASFPVYLSLLNE